MSDAETLLTGRQIYSQDRLDVLRNQIGALDSAKSLPLLTIFTAGSYARNEASVHSDVDLFFLYDRPSINHTHSRIKEIKLFADVLKIVEGMGFPEMSNDGEYLKILYLDQNLAELGGRTDDYQNHFTTRMLLLLESRAVFNDSGYNSAVSKVVESYFRDYEDHATEFRPIFLVNDILRFWKTLCLNYEHKRNQPEFDEERRIKQKVKNFKLKYSRLLTCFASVAYLSSFPEPMRPEDVSEMVSLTPLQRLKHAQSRMPSAAEAIEAATDQYVWFLRKTELPSAQLYEWFLNKDNRSVAFSKARSFGDTIFDVLREVASKNNYMRSIVL